MTDYAGRGRGMMGRALLLLVALIPCLATAEKVAITFDDLPVNGTLPAGVSEADIVRQVLPLLKGMPPAYGFINARKLEGNAAGALALKLWIDGGQRLGNHTYDHIDLSTNAVEDFQRQIDQNEPALLLLVPDDTWRWFRYPYLHEGETAEKRKSVRDHLQQRGYTIAQTTLDYEDYLWNSAYARCVDKGDAKAIEWLRTSYLETASAYFDLNREMARIVYGREISHVLLLHLGAFSPEILPPLFDLMRQKGFELTTLDEAQRDAAYRSDPDFVSSNTGTLLEQHMDARKLAYPPVPPKPRKELAALCQ